MNRAGLLRNAVYLAPAVRIFGRPVLLSTVGAAVGGDKETAPVLRRALGGIPSYGRGAVGAWEEGVL